MHSASRTGSDRSFGIVFAVFFTVVAFGPLLSQGAPRYLYLIPASVFLFLALVRPQVLAPLNRWWMAFGLLLSKVTNPIVMALLYFGFFTPMALLRRLFRSDPLKLKFPYPEKSLWVTREESYASARLRDPF